MPQQNCLKPLQQVAKRHILRVAAASAGAPADDIFYVHGCEHQDLTVHLELLSTAEGQRLYTISWLPQRRQQQQQCQPAAGAPLPGLLLAPAAAASCNQCQPGSCRGAVAAGRAVGYRV